MGALTAKGWALVAAAVVLLAIGGAGVAHLMGWRLHVAERQRDTARDDATGRGLEVTGGKALDKAAGDAQQQTDAARDAAGKLNNAAQSDPAATGQLPPSVRDRVRAGDDELCKSRPGICR